MTRVARDRGAIAASLAVTVAVAVLGGGAAVAATSTLIASRGPQDTPAGGSAPGAPAGPGEVPAEPLPAVVGYGQP